MPVVLVHGVPETPAVWEHLRSELHRSDIVTPLLPGFGCPRPDGFGSTKEEYVRGLVSELETLAAQGPVDLVGHDWGGGFVVRVVSTRPDLVRSWVTDAAGIGDVNFEWHDFAKIWQTPGEGEEFFEQQMATPPEERGSVFEMFGVPPERAVTLASWADPLMAESILALYRSAVDVGQRMGARLSRHPQTRARAPPHRGSLPLRRQCDRFRPAGGRVVGEARGDRALVDAAGPRPRRAGPRDVLVDPRLRPRPATSAGRK